MREAIRLTNKTAIAIRKSAQRLRTAYFAAAVILSVALGALGVYLGFRQLWAVPAMIAVIALMDCALMIASRSRYLAMLGQAICTEAAAREIREGKSEKKRRAQAQQDLMRMKADMQQELDQEPGAQPFFEKKDDDEDDEDLLPGKPKMREIREEREMREKQEADAPHRRRRQHTLALIRGETAK